MVGLIDKEEVKHVVLSNLGLDGLSPAYQEEILSELEQNISKQLHVSVFEKLSEDERKEFEALSALSVGDEVRGFLEERIPNFYTFALDVAKKVVQQFKDLRDAPVEVVEEDAYEIGNPDM